MVETNHKLYNIYHNISKYNTQLYNEQQFNSLLWKVRGMSPFT